MVKTLSRFYSIVVFLIFILFVSAIGKKEQYVFVGSTIAKKMAKESYDRLNAKDIEGFLEGWSEDATFSYPGDLSVSGEVRGKTAIKRWFENFGNQFPKYHITVKHVMVEEIFKFNGTNVLCVEYENNVTNKDGKSFTYTGVSVITLKKSKTINVTDYIFEIDKGWEEAWSEK